MIHWKSDNNLVGVVSGWIKPKKNNEGNTDTFAFGKARPIKHYRRGYINSSNQNRVCPTGVKTLTVQNVIDAPGSYIAANNNNNTPCVGHAIIINQNKAECQDCNSDQKAKDRVKSANTLLPKQYYQTLQQYRKANHQTFDQNTFPIISNQNQCLSSCKTTVYKKNNTKHDVQGAVSSSAHINAIHHQEIINSHENIYKTNQYPFQPKIETKNCCIK
jgi:hypothetical protein